MYIIANRQSIQGSERVMEDVKNAWADSGHLVMKGFLSPTSFHNPTRGAHGWRFAGQAGDLLIWHANLHHGGSQVIDHRLTRRSCVFHGEHDYVLQGLAVARNENREGLDLRSDRSKH